MSVQQVATHVVEVLSRAESLFGTPGQSDMAAAERMGETAEASAATAALASEMSGVLASAHGDMLAATSQRLDDTAANDARLAGHVADTGTSHAAGGSRATDLRAEAAEDSDRLGPWAELPAGELAALRALRNRVAAMQRLLADHSAEAARVAGDVRSLGYRD
jgi:hypothetical protein